MEPLRHLRPLPSTTAGLRSTFDRLPYGCLLFMHRLDLTVLEMPHGKTSQVKSWCSLWKGGFGTNPPSGGPAESINKSNHLSSLSLHRARGAPPLFCGRLQARRFTNPSDQSLHLPSICAPLSPRALKRSPYGGDALGLPSRTSSCRLSDRPADAARAGDRSAPNNLSICHRPARSFRLAP